MDKQLTLGSLFDGSGGFPLAGLLNGIKPIWKSEIEPFPILVTSKRLPDVKHYGDIAKLNGAELEPVNIITFGSPCTSLSCAGLRAGLEGKESCLFFEAIRIIKEMRCKTNGQYPRWICWENVPGAFSSSAGRDFRRVLEEIIGVVAPGTEVPAPKDYAWPPADLYLGDGWSLAYRTVDAQWFGTAQRRRRIYLVADFGGERAGDILFERPGVSRHFTQGVDAWQGTAGDSADSLGATGFDRYNGTLTGDKTQTLTAAAGASGQNMPMAFVPSGKGDQRPAPRLEPPSDQQLKNPTDICVNVQGNSGIDVTKGVVNTLVAQAHGNEPCVLHAAGFCTEHSAQSRSIGYEEEVSPTLRAGVVPAALSIENHPTDSRMKIREDGKSQTLTARAGTGGMNAPLVAEPQNVAYGISSYQSHAMLSDNPHSGIYQAETSRTLDCSGTPPTRHQGGMAVVAIQGSMIGRADQNGPQGSGVNEDVSFTLTAADKHGVAYAMTTGCFTQVEKELAPTLQHRDYKDPPIVAKDVQYVVRRLTPTECAVLQGFPRWYCSDLAIADPTEEQIAFWMKVWKEYSETTGARKSKTRAQVIRWLAKPYTDSAEYKLWGNGICLSCAVFVLGGVVEVAGEEIEEHLNNMTD